MSSDICLSGLILSLGKNINFVEIGVLKGNNLVALSHHDNITKLYGIDNYESYTDDLHGEYIVSKVLSQYNKKIATEKIENCIHKDKIQLIFEDSRIAVNKFSDEFFDFVYIDKNFTYDGVSEDINDWYPKVKKDGILGGHDWYTPLISQSVKDTLTS